MSYLQRSRWQSRVPFFDDGDCRRCRSRATADRCVDLELSELLRYRRGVGVFLGPTSNTFDQGLRCHPSAEIY